MSMERIAGKPVDHIAAKTDSKRSKR